MQNCNRSLTRSGLPTIKERAVVGAFCAGDSDRSTYAALANSFPRLSVSGGETTAIDHHRTGLCRCDRRRPPKKLHAPPSRHPAW
jgi:hypothetical protein